MSVCLISGCLDAGLGTNEQGLQPIWPVPSTGVSVQTPRQVPGFNCSLTTLHKPNGHLASHSNPNDDQGYQQHLSLCSSTLNHLTLIYTYMITATPKPAPPPVAKQWHHLSHWIEWKVEVYNPPLQLGITAHGPSPHSSQLSEWHQQWGDRQKGDAQDFRYHGNKKKSYTSKHELY